MVEFAKYQALGNDFIIVEDFEAKVKLSRGEVRRLCHRHFGIGADGLILIRSHPSYDCTMVYFNADGTRAEVCGNGLRCLAKYLYERGLKKRLLKIWTLSGVREVFFLPQNQKNSHIQVDLGEPERAVDKEIDTPQGKFRVTSLSLGNPHCVIFLKDKEKVELKKVGPVIENLPLFPKKTNVELVKVKDRSTLDLRVWERGVGETLACGSGAAAVLVAASLNRLSGRKATINLPGGKLEVEWAKDNHVYLRGPAEKVFSGNFEFA